MKRFFPSVLIPSLPIAVIHSCLIPLPYNFLSHGRNHHPASPPLTTQGRGGICILPLPLGFPHSSVGKESACNAGDPGSYSWVGKIPWRTDRLPTPVFLGFPCGSAGKESTCSAGDLGSIPGLEKIPGRRERLSIPVFWPEEFHRLYSP